MAFPKTFGLCSLFLAALVAGCSTTRFKESADREVYGIISSRSPEVPGMLAEFDAEYDPILDLDDLPRVEDVEEFLGDVGLTEEGAAVISLERALELAFRNNRSYQNQREVLYLTALNLTLERHRYTPIFSGGAGGTITRATRDQNVPTFAGQVADNAPPIIRDIGALTGTPGALINRYAQVVESAAQAVDPVGSRVEIVEERRVSGSTGFGVDLLMAGGARIAVDLTSNFMRYLTGDPRAATSSALFSSIRQPLLRGAGSKIAAERLVQAERDLLYELRSFTRYRQEFAIDIASSYYRVLQNRDQVRNNWLGYQAFLQGAERQRALADAGRLTETDLGRSVQAQLNSEDSWTGSVQSYSESLDQFKIQLGLSTDAPIVLDDNELEELRERGLDHPQINDDDAITVALATRLDFYTAKDAVDDRGRQLEVAANALKPDLDLLLTADVDSMPGDRFQELDFQRARLSAGIDLDMPFDRKAERNSYRSALINYERAVRSYELVEDSIKLEVRRAWRNLEQAQRSYHIREVGIEVNERRVEEQDLLAEAGRATTLDQIDAQNDLVAARNALTAALISHTIARLEFWRDMGILYIKEDGQWEEIDDVNPDNA